MRDPFDGYDAWLERPYQEMYERADEQEWIDEHSTFEMQCCDTDVTNMEDIWERYTGQQEIQLKKKFADWTEEEKDKWLVKCPECGELEMVNKIEPELPEYDGPEYEPPEELDDDPRNDYLNF